MKFTVVAAAVALPLLHGVAAAPAPQVDCTLVPTDTGSSLSPCAAEGRLRTPFPLVLKTLAGDLRACQSECSNQFMCMSFSLEASKNECKLYFGTVMGQIFTPAKTGIQFFSKNCKFTEKCVPRSTSSSSVASTSSTAGSTSIPVATTSSSTSAISSSGSSSALSSTPIRTTSSSAATPVSSSSSTLVSQSSTAVSVSTTSSPTSSLSTSVPSSTLSSIISTSSVVSSGSSSTVATPTSSSTIISSSTVAVTSSSSVASSTPTPTSSTSVLTSTSAPTTTSAPTVTSSTSTSLIPSSAGSCPPIATPTCASFNVTSTMGSTSLKLRYSGTGLKLSPNSPSNNNAANYPSKTTTYSGSMSECAAGQACADYTWSLGTSPLSMRYTFDLHYVKANGWWECVSYYDPLKDMTTYYTVADQQVCGAFGYSTDGYI